MTVFGNIMEASFAGPTISFNTVLLGFSLVLSLTNPAAETFTSLKAHLAQFHLYLPSLAPFLVLFDSVD